MNKNDIAKSLTRVLSSKKEADKVVDMVFGEMAKALRNKEHVVITGFGSFNPFVTRAKSGRNPKTGEKVLIDPKDKVRFKQSKDLFLTKEEE